METLEPSQEKVTEVLHIMPDIIIERAPTDSDNKILSRFIEGVAIRIASSRDILST